MYKIYIKKPFYKPDFYIETPIKELYDILKISYAPFIIDTAPLPEDNVYKMTLTDPCGRNLEMIEDAMYENADIEDDYIAIHSATVVKNKKAFLFTGFTEAGKSTLTAYLCDNGFGYFSDDLAIIKKSDLSVHPFPRPVQLREGGVAVLNKYGVDLSHTTTYSSGNVKKTCKIFPLCTSEDVILGGIFFIHRTLDINELICLPKTECFTTLLNNLYVLKSIDLELMKLVTRLCAAPAYTIKYNDMEYVKQCLLQM